MNSRKKGMTLVAKQRTAGWLFLAPASIMIAVMSFYPMIRAFIISLQTGAGANMRFADPIFSNYKRILADKVFQQSIVNTFLYLIIQVPIMLILAILLAQLLNNKDLKLRGFFRTCVFLPCATSLVSYSLIFRSMFATDGLINSILIKLGILSTGYNFLGNSTSAKIVIILALIWRWTGYNMVFYLAGLQNIEYSVYEAAKIDGANGWKTFWKITVPLLKPTIIMTFIMSINGTLQLFDESVNLTKGGPANSTITMSHYIYNTCFINVPNFGYASAMSFIIFIMVAVLAFINLKVGDTRDQEKQISHSEKIDSYLYFSDHRVIYFCIPVILDDLSCDKYINRCIPWTYPSGKSFYGKLPQSDSSAATVESTWKLVFLCNPYHSDLSSDLLYRRIWI